MTTPHPFRNAATALGLACCLLAAGCSGDGGPNSQPTVAPAIAAAEAVKLAGVADMVFVDVREPAERKVSMLPGAMSLAEFDRRRDEVGVARVIVYCTIGVRSRSEASRLRDAGLRAQNLTGGIIGWVREGGIVYDSNGPTRRVHVYGKKWSDLPPGYVPVL